MKWLLMSNVIVFGIKAKDLNRIDLGDSYNQK